MTKDEKQQTLTMAAQPPKAQKKNEVATLSAAAIFATADFSRDEISQGIDEGASAYTDAYPYIVTSDLNKFVVRKTGDDNRTEVTRLDSLDAVVWYSHSVYRLFRGAAKGLTTDRETWSDEEKEIVAQSYASPFARTGIHSRGNFDAGGYSAYLDDKTLRAGVSKRLYLICSLPGILPKGSLATVSLGSSAMIPFQGVFRQAARVGLPLAALKIKITLESAKNDAGKNYFQPRFEIALTKNGEPETIWPSAEAYRKVYASLHQKIVDTHKLAVESAENFRAGERSVESYHAQAAPVAHLDSEAMNDDEIPF